MAEFSSDDPALPPQQPTLSWQQKVNYWAIHQHDLDDLNPRPNPAPCPPQIAAATCATTWQQFYDWSQAHAADVISTPAGPQTPTAPSVEGPLPQHEIVMTPQIGDVPVRWPADAPTPGSGSSGAPVPAPDEPQD